MSIKIYPAESEIAQSILDSTKASHQIQLMPHEPTANQAKAAVEQAQACPGMPLMPMQTEDLFFFRSIMATSNVNLNDDGFDPEEMFAARNTPIAKFINIEHEADACAVEFGAGGIVGTIVESFMMDDDMNIVPNMESVPGFFHLGTTNVIWRHLSDELLRAKATILINKIEQGTVAVSMESMFAGFDYALSKDEDYKESDGTVNIDKLEIINRNEETAFMTKHLRAYGGEGVYQGRQLFRILRGITFTGLGIVEDPANPSSQILTADVKISEKTEEVASVAASSGVYKNDDTSKTESQMTDILETQLKEAQDTVAELRKELELAKENSVKADLEKSQKELEDTIAALKSKDEVIETLESAKACMCSQFEEKVAELETVQSEKAELEAKLAELDQEKVQSERIAAFKGKGYDEAEASAIVEKLAPLDANTFTVVLEGYAEKAVTADEAEITVDEVEEPAQAATASIAAQVPSEEETPEVAVAKLRDGIAQQMELNRTLKTPQGESK